MSWRWECVTRAAPFAPRDGAGGLSHRGRLWLLGGWNPQPEHRAVFPRICTNEVWSSADGIDWTLEKPGTFGTAGFDPGRDWEGRHTAGWCVHRDRLWIVCGDGNQGHYQPDTWSSADGRVWTRVDGGRVPPFMPRALQHTVAFRGSIYVMGGQTMPGFVKDGTGDALYDDVWRSADGVAWERVPVRGTHWAPRGMIGGAAVLHDRMWLLGGGTYDTPGSPVRRYYNDIWSTADGARWTCHLMQAPWPARSYHEVAAFDGRLWVIAGHYRAPGEPTAANHNDVWYSEDGIRWEELPDTPWAPRHASTVVVHGDALWVIAGNNMESDAWRLIKV